MTAACASLCWALSGWSRDGQEVDLGPRLQRALLAILVLDAGHVVPVDRLIDLLWRDEPPAAATRLGPGLHLPPAPAAGARPACPRPGAGAGHPGPRATCCASRTTRSTHCEFQALARAGARRLASGRPARGRGLADALALWHGDPLAEFGGQPWATAAAERLTQAHDLAVEDRVDAWLALGRHAQAAAELETMVAVSPLRERRWGQLMVAAYRCGRQADALRAYLRCRAVLAGELGLEPGPGLRRLEAAVLAQDPSLDWQPDAAAGAATAPAPPMPAGAQPAGEPAAASLVGRDPELAHLRSRLRQAASGHGGAVVLVGEPGAGKATLAEAAAGLAAAAGVTAAWGRCLDAAATPAFWPWSQVLRALPDGPRVQAARRVSTVTSPATVTSRARGRTAPASSGPTRRWPPRSARRPPAFRCSRW